MSYRRQPQAGGLPAHVNQPELFATSRDGLEAAFWNFHNANPVVYRMLVQYARQAKAAGLRRFGMKMLFERLRWYTTVETTDPTGLKLNNNLTSRYARLLMQQERCANPACNGCTLPECLIGLFATRELAQPTRLDKKKAA